MAKMYKGKSLKIGGGGRFQKMVDAIKRDEGVSDERARAIAAAAGRKKYGASKFAAMSAKGRER